MKFTKMQGIGNDYVYINCFETEVENPSELAIRVSERHFGIGSDGLILIKPAKDAAAFMEMYNLDGSLGLMCGNGIRCVARYLYDHKMVENTDFYIDTPAGKKRIFVNLENEKVKDITVEMGSPVTKAEKIPVISKKEEMINEPVEVDQKTVNITCVSMGNPHAVVFVDDVSTLNLAEIGPHFENHQIFPERVNTEFIEVINKNEIKMRVWERGSGETMACGTGACASAYACLLNGKCEGKVTVHLLGGDLQIEYDDKRNIILMTGPAQATFEGEFFI